MTDKRKTQGSEKDDGFDPQGEVPQKDPAEWKTGDEKMTAAQASYLNTLATEAGEEVDPEMTKAEASRRIDALQEKTGRGRSH